METSEQKFERFLELRRAKAGKEQIQEIKEKSEKLAGLAAKEEMKNRGLLIYQDPED